MSRGRRRINFLSTMGLALLALAAMTHPAQAQSGIPLNVDDLPPTPAVPVGGDPADVPFEPPGLEAIDSAAAPAFNPGPAPVDAGDAPPRPTATEADLSPIPPAPTGGSADAPIDPEVVPVQTPPPLGDAPASPAPAASASAPTAGGPFLVAPDRLPVGAQAAGVSIQVVAPATMNLNKPALVTIQVKNTGATDAFGVVVRDQLPDGATFVEARPAPDANGGGLLTWNLGDLPAGTDRRLEITVTPTTIGNQDHAATVAFLAGSRSRTLVQEPKLRVELAAGRGPVLRGQQVQFDINVTNTGTGPARDVLVRADLSEGLSHPSEGRILELDLAGPPFNKKTLQPGENIRLPALIVDTIGGGEQACTVKVTSPDVIEAPDSQKVATVTIVEPKLEVALDGPQTRFTEFDAEYALTVKNPGTAPARSVRVTATLVGDARVYQPARGGVWESSRKSITWTINQLEPGQSETFPVKVRLGSVGVFQLNGEAVGAGPGLKAHGSFSTSVEGNAYLELAVTEEMRILDVGQEPVFKLQIRNIGTKEARQVKVKAQLSGTLKAIETAGTEQNAGVDEASNTVEFPLIDRIPPNAEMTLFIKAQAVKDGLATCRAFLTHQDIQYEVEGVANATIIGAASRR